MGLKRKLRWIWRFRLRFIPRVYPDFIVIGGMKCGTSSLYRHLCLHPQVLPSFTKEVNFLTHNFERGSAWYRCNFPSTFAMNSRGNLKTGEASPHYISDPEVPKRVRELVPEVKLIALLRDPVMRAYSDYHMFVRAQLEKRSFERAIEAEEHAKPEEQPELPYIGRGIYVDQLRRWRDHFPGSQLLILRSEDLWADPVGTLETVCRFVGLAPFDWSSVAESLYPRNVGAYEQDMTDEMRERLISFYRPHNDRLCEYLGRDMHWTGHDSAHG